MPRSLVEKTTAELALLPRPTKLDRTKSQYLALLQRHFDDIYAVWLERRGWLTYAALLYPKGKGRRPQPRTIRRLFVQLLLERGLPTDRRKAALLRRK
ncbi:MAG: hypothetical protein ACYDG3_04865 [Bacillati bacterium]